MPNYFSGTNCHIYGQTRLCMDGLHTAVFSIGGEPVWSVDYPDPQVCNYYVLAADPGVVFDSTHFANGSLTVTLDYTTWGGSSGHIESSAPVINQFTAWGRNDFEDTGAEGQKGIPTVAAKCTAMNIASYSQWLGIGWSSDMVLNHLGLPTVIYVHTHGSYDVSPVPPGFSPSVNVYFESDTNDLGIPQANRYGEAITPAQVLAIRQNAFGSGTAPFNTGSPPVWLAFVDGCYTGSGNQFANAFLWPYWTQYNTRECNDQAECGWTISKQSDQTLACATAFWNHIKDGWTADEARLRLFDAYNGANKPQDQRQLVHVWGDWNTRLHGVYTDSSGQETRWYFVP